MQLVRVACYHFAFRDRIGRMVANGQTYLTLEAFADNGEVCSVLNQFF